MESVDSSIVHTIASILLNAATNRRLVTYKRLHALFDANVTISSQDSGVTDGVSSSR